jgi:hypothetical protein
MIIYLFNKSMKNEEYQIKITVVVLGIIDC